MKAALLVATVVAVLTGAIAASAHATIATTAMIATAETTTPHRLRARIRDHVVAHGYARIFDRRKLGMVCVLPPDVQVERDWPGPACAYDDNFIFLPHRHHRRIK
jgi:hypothetical protein